jgi:hypothetical protein
MVAKAIATLLTTLSSSWWRCGAVTANVEVGCFERHLFVQVARNLFFTETTFNFVRARQSRFPICMGRHLTTVSR